MATQLSVSGGRAPWLEPLNYGLVNEREGHDLTSRLPQERSKSTTSNARGQGKHCQITTPLARLVLSYARESYGNVIAYRPLDAEGGRHRCGSSVQAIARPYFDAVCLILLVLRMYCTSSSRPPGEGRYPRIRRRRAEGSRSAPKKGPSRCGGGGGGDSMNDDDICSCMLALRDRQGRCGCHMRNAVSAERLVIIGLAGRTWRKIHSTCMRRIRYCPPRDGIKRGSGALFQMLRQNIAFKAAHNRLKSSNSEAGFLRAQMWN